MTEERPVTRRQLMRGTGERGAHCLVAFGGMVYDVTDCPKWRTGFHEQLHFAGQDLTAEIAEAPHEMDVFRRPCVHRIGPLVDE
jgi:predicted heme/steroid binding protein